jgi:hypothetical protein
LALNIDSFQVSYFDYFKLNKKDLFSCNKSKVTSSQNFTICGNTVVNSTYGIVTSVNYPQWLTGQSCNRTITAPEGSTIRAYITDISIEPANQNNAY